MQWTAEVLDELKTKADPEADRIAEAYQDRYPDFDLRGLIRQVRADMYDPAAAPGVAARLPRPVLGPALRRADKLALGQQVFARYGLEIAAGLYFGSFPAGYAMEPFAEALARTSDLATGSLNRRVAETGQMMIDVMGVEEPDTLQPGTRGYASCQGVRLMHALVRALILDQDERARAGDPDATEWDFDRLGMPLSQEAMLATILGFTYVGWLALDRFGITLDKAERDAHAYAWSVVAGLLGVEEQYLPLDSDDMDQLAPLLWDRHVRRCDSGVRLYESLMEEIEEFTPLGLRRVPASMIRWLFRGTEGTIDLARVPTALDVAEPSMLAYRMFDSQRLMNRALDPVRDTRAGRWFFRRLSRAIITGYVDRYVENQPAFYLPDTVAKDWRIRTGNTTARVRQVRSRGRQAVRSRQRSA